MNGAMPDASPGFFVRNPEQITLGNGVLEIDNMGLGGYPGLANYKVSVRRTTGSWLPGRSTAATVHIMMGFRGRAERRKCLMANATHGAMVNIASILCLGDVCPIRYAVVGAGVGGDGWLCWALATMAAWAAFQLSGNRAAMPLEGWVATRARTSRR